MKRKPYFMVEAPKLHLVLMNDDKWIAHNNEDKAPGLNSLMGLISRDREMKMFLSQRSYPKELSCEHEVNSLTRVWAFWLIMIAKLKRNFG